MIPNGNHDSGPQSCGTGVIGRRGSVTQEDGKFRAQISHIAHGSGELGRVVSSGAAG